MRVRELRVVMGESWRVPERLNFVLSVLNLKIKYFEGRSSLGSEEGHSASRANGQGGGGEEGLIHAFLAILARR